MLVDHAHFLQDKFIADADVSLSGHVSYTDNNFMEVTAYVRQSGMLLAKGIFVVEARDAINNGPAPVNPLVPANELEESLHQEAQKRHQERAKALYRLESQQPTKEEQPSSCTSYLPEPRAMTDLRRVI